MTAALAVASRSRGGVSSYGAGVAVLVVLGMVVIAGLVSVFSRRWRRPALRFAWLTAAGLVACYAVARGIAEFWVVNYSDAASYEHSWGGPSLAAVFAVHSGPGLVIVIAAVWWLLRRRRAQERTRPCPEP
jgi:hypothetical protein